MSGDLEVYLEFFGELCEQLQGSKSLDYEDMGRFVYAEKQITGMLDASGGAAPGAFAEFVERQRAFKSSWHKQDWDLYSRLKNPESGGEVILASARDPGANLSAREKSLSDISGQGSARSPGSGRTSHSELKSIFGHVRTLEGIATSLSCKDLKEVVASDVNSTRPSVQPHFDGANFSFAAAPYECGPGSRSARQLTARILEEGLPRHSLQEYHKTQDDRRLYALGLTPRGPRVQAQPIQDIAPQRMERDNTQPPSSRWGHSPACRVLDSNAVPVTPLLRSSHSTPAVTAAAVTAWPAAQASVVAPSVAATVVAEPALQAAQQVPEAVSATAVTPKSSQNSARGKCAVWIKGGGERASAGLRRAQSAAPISRTRSSLSEPEAEAETRDVRAPRAASPKLVQRGKEPARFSQVQIGELYQEIRVLREEKNSEVEQLRSECRGLRMALEKSQREIKELKEDVSLKKSIREKEKENQEPVDSMDTARISEVVRREMQRVRMVKEGCDRAISLCR